MTDSTSGDLVQYNAPDFGVIPAELMCDQRLSRSARLLGCLLWSYRNKDTGEAWPSQKTLGDRLGVSARSIQKYMAALREHGWMTSQHRISVDPGYHGNPGALIHTLQWSLGLEQPFPSNKGKPEATFVSKANISSGTTRTSTAQEHTNRTNQVNKDIYWALCEKSVYRSVAKELSQIVKPKDLEAALSKGLEGGALVAFLRGEYIEPAGKSGTSKEYKQGEFANSETKFCPGGCGSLVDRCTCNKFMTHAEYQSTIAADDKRGGKSTVAQELKNNW